MRRKEGRKDREEGEGRKGTGRSKDKWGEG